MIELRFAGYITETSSIEYWLDKNGKKYYYDPDKRYWYTYIDDYETIVPSSRIRRLSNELG